MFVLNDSLRNNRVGIAVSLIEDACFSSWRNPSCPCCWSGIYMVYGNRGKSKHRRGGMGAATSRKWSSGFCSCGDDCCTCCITFWLPCITFGRNAEILDEGHTSCSTHGCVYFLLCMIQCHWIYSCIYRKKLRSKYGLDAEPCCDCGVHFCCDSCALCQEHAELRSRGFDTSKGWAGRPMVPPMRFPMFK